MFWPLLLAHLLADYPLQTNRMVQAKRHLPGLLLHVAVHLLTMVLVVALLTPIDWSLVGPFLILLTVLHFGIDTGKNFVSRQWPTWVILPYLMDQVVHVISIILVSFLLMQAGGNLLFDQQAPWIILLSSYILVTYVWFITERVLFYKDKGFQQWAAATQWSRMISRAAFLSLLLVFLHAPLWGPPLFGTPSFGPLVSAGLVIAWPYRAGQYQGRAMLIDAAVVLVGTVLVELTL